MKRLAAPAGAKLVTKLVDYKDGDVALQGYAVWDDGFKDKRPGILVAHEWYGNGPYSKRRADMLAKLGYTAFALDMYGKGVYAKDHEQAAKLAGIFFNDRSSSSRERARTSRASPASTATSPRRIRRPRSLKRRSPCSRGPTMP